MLDFLTTQIPDLLITALWLIPVAVIMQLIGKCLPIHNAPFSWLEEKTYLRLRRTLLALTWACVGVIVISILFSLLT